MTVREIWVPLSGMRISVLKDDFSMEAGMLAKKDLTGASEIDKKIKVPGDGTQDLEWEYLTCLFTWFLPSMIIMPVLCNRFFPSQDFPLFIKGMVPSHTNIIILCGVSITLSVTICLIRRSRRIGRTNRRPDERWENSEDEKHLYTTPSPLSQPISPIINRVNFITDIEDNQRNRTMTSMSETPQTDNLDLQRRRSYSSKASGSVDEASGEIVIAEGWRRHTRVYGGGVCQACVESEERMRAMNLNLQAGNLQGQNSDSAGDNLAENSAQEEPNPQVQTSR